MGNTWPFCHQASSKEDYFNPVSKFKMLVIFARNYRNKSGAANQRVFAKFRQIFKVEFSPNLSWKWNCNLYSIIAVQLAISAMGKLWKLKNTFVSTLQLNSEIFGCGQNQSFFPNFWNFYQNFSGSFQLQVADSKPVKT